MKVLRLGIEGYFMVADSAGRGKAASRSAAAELPDSYRDSGKSSSSMGISNVNGKPRPDALVEAVFKKSETYPALDLSKVQRAEME